MVWDWYQSSYHIYLKCRTWPKEDGWVKWCLKKDLHKVPSWQPKSQSTPHINISILYWYISCSTPHYKLLHVQLTHRWNWKPYVGLSTAIINPTKMEKAYFSVVPLVHGLKKEPFAKALKLELIHRPTVDESFLLELLTYSTYCDNFMTTIADFKGAGF